MVKEKSTKKDLVLDHPTHGKIIVSTRPHPSSGHWVFSLPNKKKGGTLVDLLRQEQWDWKAIKELAQGCVATPIAELTSKPKTYAVARYIEHSAARGFGAKTFSRG